MSTELMVKATSLLASKNVTGGTYGVAAMCLTTELDAERALACAENLNKIGKLENTETVEMLRHNGQLTVQEEELCHSLKIESIDSDKLTLPEVKSINEYINDATDDVRKDKMDKIIDLLAGVINGTNVRRDFSFDPVKAEILDNLLTKGVEYDRGNIDTTIGFDVSQYPNDRYDLPQRDLLEAAKSLTLEELLEGGYISDQDVYRYGPYTERDLSDMEYYLKGTWVRTTDSRNKTRLETFLDESILDTEPSVGADINRSFIADIVISARRLTARNIIATLGAFGKHSSQLMLKPPSVLKKTEQINEFKKHMYLCSYYAGIICRLSGETIKENYKVARPISREFYQFLIDRSGEWTEGEEELIERDFPGMLNKLDDHLFQAQAVYGTLMAMLDKTKQPSREVHVKELLPQF